MNLRQNCFEHCYPYERNAGEGPSARLPNGRGNGAAAAVEESSMGPVQTVFERLATTGGGLTEPEVKERLEQYGRNEVAHERPTPWPVMLLHNFRNPFILLLLVLGAVSYATGDLRGRSLFQ